MRITAVLWAMWMTSAGMACQQRGGDTPSSPWDVRPEAPDALPVAFPEADKVVPPLADDPSCNAGTGRNTSGRCESLRTRQQSYVQQLQIPYGGAVIGRKPDHYDAMPARRARSPLWSGQPLRRLHLDAFWIDIHEVTREAYAACVAAGACTQAECLNRDTPGANVEGSQRSDEPQTCVSHAQAVGFCQAQGGRLPRESEWEYAARGPTAHRYTWGNALRDEFGRGLVPVGGWVDISYFGVRGLGSNGTEWVSEAYALDAGTAAFIKGRFRHNRGPVLRSLLRPAGFVVKHAIVGRREHARGPDMGRGFRCVHDVGRSEEPLALPVDPVPVTVVEGEDPALFVGMAEAVSWPEAKKFCARLNVSQGSTTWTDWTLPRLDEIVRLGPSFRGPGPVWTRDRTAVAHVSKEGAASVVWGSLPLPPSELLMARCVRRAVDARQ